jgi:hypothetical protein
MMTTTTSVMMGAATNTQWGGWPNVLVMLDILCSRTSYFTQSFIQSLGRSHAVQ